MIASTGSDSDHAQLSAWRRGLPIVVGGCHRSGTTLVRRILDAHSRISCGPELKFLLDFHDGYTLDDELRHARFTTTARSHVPDAEAFTILGVAFIQLHERRARRERKDRWADKNPENALYLDAWGRLLGSDFVFVHVVRDPLDVLASMEEAQFPYSNADRASDRADHIARYVGAARAFQERFPERSFEVRYESLVRAPEQEVARLMEWLGEEPEPAQLAPAGTADGLGDPKSRPGFDQGSVGRWHRDLGSDQIEAAREAAAALGSISDGIHRQQGRAPTG